MNTIVKIWLPNTKETWEVFSEMAPADIRAMSSWDVDGVLYGIDDIRIVIKKHKRPDGTFFGDTPHMMVKEVIVYLGTLDTDQFEWAEKTTSGELKTVKNAR